MPCVVSSAAARTTSTPPRTPSTCSSACVAARTGRGLTTVVDTLGTDEDRRRRWLARAREVGLPAVAVVMDTPDAECRRRNSARDRPVPAPTLAGQLKRHRAVVPQLEVEGWDVVHTVRADDPAEPSVRPGDRAGGRGAAYVAGAQGGAPGEPVPVGRGPAGLADRRRPGRRRGRLRGVVGDGPPHPDPPGGPGVGLDPRAVGDPRRGRRPRHRSRAGHPGHAGDVPGARHHRQGGGHPGRADRWPRLRRRRRRLVGARARGVRPRLPGPQAAARRPRARHRDDEGALGAGHQGVRRRTGQPSRDDLLPAAGGRHPGDRGRDQAAHSAHRGHAR